MRYVWLPRNSKKVKKENWKYKRLLNLILVTCLIIKKVQYKLIKLLQVGCNSTHQDSRTIFYKAFSFKIRRIKMICSYSREKINLVGEYRSNQTIQERKRSWQDKWTNFTNYHKKINMTTYYENLTVRFHIILFLTCMSNFIQIEYYLLSNL